ncbi:OsmC family protein [Flavobacterium sp. K77]|uniref:OsmC family protein n=1 Tax=Flavobacterium sp. K77 TaxID=2910676 RepID=UPI001F26BFA5|nr:OsmC family protein [Flavobacterium sp. K77]MCF6142260.1 OsmC family protein [Flavobacterium sp. K77]
MGTLRKATATWNGTGLEGKGTLNSKNQFFNNTPYSFNSRFENADGTQGTNPEELLAAAHAGCFAMALSFAVTQAGFTPEVLHVEAKVALDAVGDGFEISVIKLHLTGEVSGMTESQFNELAEGVKLGCPISKALSATPIELITQFTTK